MAETATQTIWTNKEAEPATPAAGLPALLHAILKDFTRSIPTDTARRVLRLVSGFRLSVAMALLAVTVLFTDPPLLGTKDLELFVTTAIAYCAVAIGFVAIQRAAWAPTLVPVEVLLDIVAVAVLSYASGGVSSGIGGLLVVFVGAASLALTARYALFAAALATLAVLGEQIASFIQGTSISNEFISAGVLGAIILMTAAVANPLARRLEESEALARQRGIDLANLAQLNDYIIQNLRESIVVVDAANDVRLMNQPAAEVLGASSRTPGQPLQQVSAAVFEAVLNRWREGRERLAQLPT